MFRAIVKPLRKGPQHRHLPIPSQNRPCGKTWAFPAEYHRKPRNVSCSCRTPLCQHYLLQQPSLGEGNIASCPPCLKDSPSRKLVHRLALGPGGVRVDVVDNLPIAATFHSSHFLPPFISLLPLHYHSATVKVEQHYTIAPCSQQSS